MNILVLNGSPRPNGNTSKMVAAFRSGAEENGNEVNVVEVCKLDISGCIGCEYCHTKGNGTCFRKDDMQKVYALLKEAEMLVIASPIYYHGLSGQIKCVIDRFYSVLSPDRPSRLKKVAMFLSSGDPDMYEGARFSYEGDFVEYLGLEGMGIFTSHGEENGSPAKLQELREFGRACSRK